MKFKDPVAWTDQEIELQADEPSRQFLAFFVKWFTEAEHQLAEIELGWGDDPEQVVTAVNQALAEIETPTEFLSMEWIGQMLLVATQHWKYGDELHAGLSAMELRMLTQMAAVKLAELQRLAVDSPNAP